MIVPDANVLLFAANSASAQHRAALRALEAGFMEPLGVGFAWIALLAFLRLSTRSGIFPRPLTADDALRIVERWLEQPGAQIVNPGEAHAAVLAELLRTAGTAGNLTSDAHLAALAIERNATVVTFDRDFARFAGVRWRHPQAMETRK